LHGAREVSSTDAASFTVPGREVVVADLVKRYGKTTAVDDISFVTQAGEFVTLLGPSGSGKTTTLMMIAGLVTPTAGDIRIGGVSVVARPPHRRDIGVIFQQYALFPHMSVFDNVAYPLRNRRQPRDTIREKVVRVLELVGLSGFEARSPRQLSGGQQQRVALARAIVFEPSVLLMDEPLGALDRKLRERMQLELKRLQQRLNVTVIFVTHDQAEALILSDRVIVMDHGKVVQMGTPADVYHQPRSDFVANFIGETNLLRGSVITCRNGWLEIALESGLRIVAEAGAGIAVGDLVRLSLRPERLWFGPPPHGDAAAMNRVDGTVEEVVFLGELTAFVVESREAGRFVVKRLSSEPALPAQGRPVQVFWRAADSVVMTGSA
jgi:putative spermidine/putrescine transport system ATP-binding protein